MSHAEEMREKMLAEAWAKAEERIDELVERINKLRPYLAHLPTCSYNLWMRGSRLVDPPYCDCGLKTLLRQGLTK
jgi:hypothetical protein